MGLTFFCVCRGRVVEVPKLENLRENFINRKEIEAFQPFLHAIRVGSLNAGHLAKHVPLGVLRNLLFERILGEGLCNQG